ncbi:MAG: hypothetical protein ACJ79H_03345 [Myxococcales bacterium]
MYTSTGSEAREWRRCSLLALAVLLFSVAGEAVVSAHEEDGAPRKAGNWRCVMDAPARSWSLLNYFVAPLSR